MIISKPLFYAAMVSTTLVGLDAMYHAITAASNTESTLAGLVAAAAAINLFLLEKAEKADSAPTPPNAA